MTLCVRYSGRARAVARRHPILRCVPRQHTVSRSTGLSHDLFGLEDQMFFLTKPRFVSATTILVQSLKGMPANAGPGTPGAESCWQLLSFCRPASTLRTKASSLWNAALTMPLCVIPS